MSNVVDGAVQSGVGGAQGVVGERTSRPAPVRPVVWTRIVLGTAAVVVVAAGLAMNVRALPDGGVAAVVAAVLGMVVVPLVASPIEWFVHRFVYHEPAIRGLSAIFVVHTAHHHSYFPTWRYVTGGPARRLSLRGRAPSVHRSAVRNAAVRAAHFGWYMTFGVVLILTPAWFLIGDVWFLAGAALSSVVVSNLFITVHDTIHRPGSHRVIERQRWFAFLDRHHYVHHVDLGCNLNFLLPLADLLFGTLRTSLTAEEVGAHGTLAAAKSTMVGEGERANAARSDSSDPVYA